MTYPSYFAIYSIQRAKKLSKKKRTMNFAAPYAMVQKITYN